MRLLLLDDDDLVLATYASLLRDLDFEVDTASRAPDALQKITAQKYDVLLSDIQMPGMSGVEFLKAVRQIDLDVPVILMTGGPTVESAIEALEFGAFRYLRKPVPHNVLEETVRRAARYHALARLKRDAIELTGGAANWPSDRAALEGRFESAREKLWMAVQPIVSYRERTVHAYEALVRSDEPTLSAPEALLKSADTLGRSVELGRAIRRKCAGLRDLVPQDARLFINLHPEDLNDPDLLSPESPLVSFSSRIVFEITERASLHNVGWLSRRREELRALGYRLAVDDLGAGYAGLTSMAQLEPEYVKLDMSLIRGIDHHPTQQKLVRSMVNLCQELGKHVIAEGVEAAAECSVLVEMGCDLLQGYFFARPSRELPKIAWDGSAK